MKEQGIPYFPLDVELDEKFRLIEAEYGLKGWATVVKLFQKIYGEFGYTNKYFIVNPIAYWSDEYLWNYIESEKIEINPLYSEGFCRIGCIGCPMAGKHREEEFKRYPKYKERYIKLCNEIMTIRKQEGLTNKYNFRTGEDYFNFWLNNKLPEQEYDLFKI